MAAVGSVYRAVFLSSIPNQIAEQVLHYYILTIAGTGATDQQIATALDAAVGPVTRALLSTAATYSGCRVQRINIPPMPIYRTATGQAGIGALAGDMLPTQTSGLISLRTDLAGGSKRGRVYLPFPNEGSSGATGLPTSAYITLLTNYLAAAGAVITAGSGGNTNTMSLAIWSRKTLSKELVTSGIIAASWATQRRRGALGRPNVPPF